MNRDDLLKRCVDRRVAHETSVVAVSHLFYVYLLSALKKGQRVEVPNFGTFGTRMVGVKRAKRMPYFEVEKDLADKVNERYHNLKSLLVGTYELTPVTGEVEYKGKEVPHDTVVDEVGKEVILDTYKEVTVDEFRPETRKEEIPSPPKEKKLMPKFNLRDEGETEPEHEQERFEEAPPRSERGPRLREMSATSGPSPFLQILLAVLILGAITFALNYFGVIHLWGKKTPATVESLPEAIEAPPVTEEIPPEPQITPTPTPEVTPKATTPTPAQQEPQKKAPTPVPVEKPKQTLPPSGTGDFTVQVSSWTTQSKANDEVARLAQGGFDAYVQEAVVGGQTWYRVRVGRYGSQRDAESVSAKLQGMYENRVWVARVGR